MSLALKTPTYPACHGIACHLHNRCARYTAVEAVGPSDPNTLGTCIENGDFPEFSEIETIPLAEMAAQAGHA